VVRPIFRQSVRSQRQENLRSYKFGPCGDTRGEEWKRGWRIAPADDGRSRFRNDQRLTPIGRYLRKFSIDEWPKLVEYPARDMSLVGPRPAVPMRGSHKCNGSGRSLRMRPDWRALGVGWTPTSWICRDLDANEHPYSTSIIGRWVSIGKSLVLNDPASAHGNGDS